MSSIALNDPQLVFKSRYGESLTEKAMRNHVEALAENCHEYYGWIFLDNRLRVKDSDEEENRDDYGGSCHYHLFGDLAYQAHYLGWYDPFRHSTTIGANWAMRVPPIESPDLIPERLYRALVNEFGHCSFVIL